MWEAGEDEEVEIEAYTLPGDDAEPVWVVVGILRVVPRDVRGVSRDRGCGSGRGSPENGRFLWDDKMRHAG